MSFKILKIKNIVYGEFTEFCEQGIIAAVSFRLAGRSSPPFDSLNLGLHTEDNKTNVLKNRRLFFNSLDINYRDIVTLKQVHSNKAVIIQKAGKGSGALDYNGSIAEADGMVTKVPGIPLVIFTADCMPIFFMDPVNKIVGLAHAGWKGTLHCIAEKIINYMKKLGAKPRDIIAGLGPAICARCYEIGDDLVEKFSHTFIKIKRGRHYLDLDKANTDGLISAGVKREHIIHSHYCTSCHPETCFSYRKAGTTGRMASVIMIKEY